MCGNLSAVKPAFPGSVSAKRKGAKVENVVRVASEGVLLGGMGCKRNLLSARSECWNRSIVGTWDDS
jgi:hypothetical protein